MKRQTVLLAVTFATVFAPIASASSDPSYRIEMEIAKGGIVISSPAVEVVSGNTVSVQVDGPNSYILDLTPTQEKDDRILIATKLQLAGKEPITPKLLVKNGGEASISVGEFSITFVTNEVKSGS